MNPSAELKNAMLRLYESESADDVSVLEHLVSRQDGVVAIGTNIGVTALCGSMFQDEKIPGVHIVLLM